MIYPSEVHPHSTKSPKGNPSQRAGGIDDVQPTVKRNEAEGQQFQMGKASIVVRAAPVSAKGGAGRPACKKALVPTKPKNKAPSYHSKLKIGNVFTNRGYSSRLATIVPPVEGIRTESPPAAIRYPASAAKRETPLCLSTVPKRRAT